MLRSIWRLDKNPFSVLLDHTHLLDFDIKRCYFREKMEKNRKKEEDERRKALSMCPGGEALSIRREDLVVYVKREHVFEDSFRELHHRSPDEWNKLLSKCINFIYHLF